MVIVSSRELSVLIVPVPDIAVQERIVRDIQNQIEKQSVLQEQISSLRNQIEQIIIETISKN